MDDTMRKRFYDILLEWRNVSGKNSVSLTKDQYDSLIEEVLAAKHHTCVKTARITWLLLRYDVITIHGTSRLIFPVVDVNDKILYYSQGNPWKEQLLKWAKSQRSNCSNEQQLVYCSFEQLLFFYKCSFEQFYYCFD